MAIINVSSPFSQALLADLRKAAGVHNVRVLRELYRDGGTCIAIQVGELEIEAIDGIDFSIAVRRSGEGEWAAIPYLASYLEKDNDLRSGEKMANSKDQLLWFLANFDEVYSFIQHPERADDRAAFFKLQSDAFARRTDELVQDFRKHL